MLDSVPFFLLLLLLLFANCIPPLKAAYEQASLCFPYVSLTKFHSMFNLKSKVPHDVFKNKNEYQLTSTFPCKFQFDVVCLIVHIISIFDMSIDVCVCVCVFPTSHTTCQILNCVCQLTCILCVCASSCKNFIKHSCCTRCHLVLHAPASMGLG